MRKNLLRKLKRLERVIDLRNAPPICTLLQVRADAPAGTSERLKELAETGRPLRFESGEPCGKVFIIAPAVCKSMGEWMEQYAPAK